MSAADLREPDGLVQTIGRGRITGVADVRAAGSTDLGFIRDAEYKKLARQTGAGALLVTEPLETEVYCLKKEEKKGRKWLQVGFTCRDSSGTLVFMSVNVVIVPN